MVTKKNRTGDKENVVEYGPLKNLSIHEAFTILAVYAAQLDRKYNREAIQCIKELTQKHSILSKTAESSEKIIARINLFTNQMSGTEPMKVVEIATKALSQPLREEAFQFAKDTADLCNLIPEKKLNVLNFLATKLGLDKNLIDDLAVCSKAPEFAEHQRFADADEPCDDGRSGKI
jgi:hypothetical protein